MFQTIRLFVNKNVFTASITQYVKAEYIKYKDFLIIIMSDNQTNDMIPNKGIPSAMSIYVTITLGSYSRIPDSDNFGSKIGPTGNRTLHR